MTGREKTLSLCYTKQITIPVNEQNVNTDPNHYPSIPNLTPSNSNNTADLINYCINHTWSQIQVNEAAPAESTQVPCPHIS